MKFWSDLPPGWKWVVWCLAIMGSVLLILPGFEHSDCGGNPAALAACKGYVRLLEIWQPGQDGSPFEYDRADPEKRQALRNLPGTDFLPSVRLLVRRYGVKIDCGGMKQVIMVCDQPFDNVPRHRFWKAPMAHAVAWSTGEVGLISPKAFAALDLSGFVDLRAGSAR